jgi:integrase
MATITTTALRGRWRGTDRWLSDGGARGAGRLTARITRDATLLYFQYFHDGRLQRVPLGPYDETGARGLSLVAARDRAAELAALYRSGTTDLQAHLRREQEAREAAARAAEEAARRAAEDAQRGTLRQLLQAYCAHLERNGKQSAADARSILTRHVIEAAPDLAGRKAADLGVDDFVAVLGRLVEAAKGRTAAKLRSYLRAAFQLALASRTDPTAPLAMRAFGIVANPISGIGALSKYSRARDRHLSGPELGALLRRIEMLEPGPKRDALLLTLYLGGQRPMQLLRLKGADVDLSAGSVTLYDAKGARQQPRRHVLPLVKEAAAIVQVRIDGKAATAPVFSTDGKTALRPETLSMAVADISRAMTKAGEAREPFQLRDLRRTCETMMAALGVSSDVRAQLQSHGLGGVQNRHYDRHGYEVEKRRALDLWARHLELLKSGETGTVTPMRRPAMEVRT